MWRGGRRLFLIFEDSAFVSTRNGVTFTGKLLAQNPTLCFVRHSTQFCRIAVVELSGSVRQKDTSRYISLCTSWGGTNTTTPTSSTSHGVSAENEFQLSEPQRQRRMPRRVTRVRLRQQQRSPFIQIHINPLRCGLSGFIPQFPFVCASNDLNVVGKSRHVRSSFGTGFCRRNCVMFFLRIWFSLKMVLNALFCSP